MWRDDSRMTMVRRLMAARGLDGLLCKLGHNVLMLTGYQPILGSSFAVLNQDGRVILVVPHSERDVAEESWVTDVLDFEATTLTRLESAERAALPLLGEAARRLGIDFATIGVEVSYDMVPASYSMFGAVSPELISMYRGCMPLARLVDASDVLEELRAVKTPAETDRIRAAYALCGPGFEAAKVTIEAGVTESQVAGAVTQAILAHTGSTDNVLRVLAFAHVMSGPRSAYAYRPYNMSGVRVIQVGDPVLVQLEVSASGYWAEMTRTFSAGQPTQKFMELYEICAMAQQQAALVIADGISAATVDKVARDYITQRGYGEYFLHGLGHGVGFQPISHHARPRLHPASPDHCRTGMIHNIEPAIYMQGFGGIRINDTVLDLEKGAEYLSEVDRNLPWVTAY